ncbi:MAG: hypothetical protein ACR2O3_15125 [Rhizobiaceae bacterium]
MNENKQPYEVEKPDMSKKNAGAPKYNSVTKNEVPLVVRKKRQFGGLMCPPMATFGFAEDSAQGEKPEFKN